MSSSDVANTTNGLTMASSTPPEIQANPDDSQPEKVVTDAGVPLPSTTPIVDEKREISFRSGDYCCARNCKIGDAHLLKKCHGCQRSIHDECSHNLILKFGLKQLSNIEEEPLIVCTKKCWNELQKKPSIGAQQVTVLDPYHPS